MGGPGFEWRGVWGALGVLAGVFGMLFLPLLADAVVAQPVVTVRDGDVVTLRAGDAGGARVDLGQLAGLRRPATLPPDSVSAGGDGVSVSVELKTGVVEPAVTFARLERLYDLRGRPVSEVSRIRTATGLAGFAGRFGAAGTLVLLGGPGTAVSVSAEGLADPALRALLAGVVIEG